MCVTLNTSRDIYIYDSPKAVYVQSAKELGHQLDYNIDTFIMSLELECQL